VIPVIRACHVSLAYSDGDVTNYAVRDVSLEIPERGFFGIMGPSGSGKSSMLYLLSGLKQATAGEVFFRNRRYHPMSEREMAQMRRDYFGFVFQQPFLLNYLTVLENVLAAAPQGDCNSAERAQELLDHLHIAHLRYKYPYHLSGGERQRVCVARAMINDPQVIFADEPTAALDHKNGHTVIDLLSSYRDRGAVIVVTHDPEMLTGADRIFLMRDGELESAVEPQTSAI
jgi:putative ABC transport system ATP-binding protein